MIRIKHLAEIMPVTTSHHVGEKRVLTSKEETQSNITQMAVTKLKAGERAEKHAHPTMEEFFFFRKGKAVIVTEEGEWTCEAEDFVQVTAGTTHELRAVTDVEVMTIGCAIEPENV